MSKIMFKTFFWLVMIKLDFPAVFIIQNLLWSTDERTKGLWCWINILKPFPMRLVHLQKVQNWVLCQIIYRTCLQEKYIHLVKRKDVYMKRFYYNLVFALTTRFTVRFSLTVLSLRHKDSISWVLIALCFLWLLLF